jgi:hypothetical protein
LGSKGSEIQGSAPPPAKKTAGQIEKETKVLKIPNLKHQITNKSQISIFKDQNLAGQDQLLLNRQYSNISAKIGTRKEILFQPELMSFEDLVWNFEFWSLELI